MTGYSLSFFATGRYDKEWWDTLTPEKARAALIDMGWMPPEVAGEFKAAFRANMLRRAQPGEDIDAEIDRVFAQMEKS